MCYNPSAEIERYLHPSFPDLSTNVYIQYYKFSYTIAKLCQSFQGEKTNKRYLRKKNC